ncbi:hypothetical protein ES703_46236 [subsurface metagenome]
MSDVALYATQLLVVLADEKMYWRKTSVFPSQKRIQNELKKKFGTNISIRTLNRWLAKIESAGLLRRMKRHKKHPLLGWLFRSSLYTIMGGGWKMLIKAGWYTWNQFNDLIKEAKANFRKPKKTRKVERPSGNLTHVGEVIKHLGFDTS